ncbi:hypothetical protein ADU59_04795 [Pararhizobium polonicum]|uniref:Uncharacterized protein n=1 Tax=Pararhizobium polonicum TaxID=1612624 RepID=A0A1C7PBD5_9HYPH|nr:hypothetical protein [Pararhizobium polonicum]OBZ97014.1 hypothetical protein ADU59_04795 [Pararhizobium polonicum]
MLKRSLLISTLALCASLSFVPAQAAPSTAAISGLASCSSACVAQAQALVAEINAMPAGPAKDKLLLALVKSIGALAIANPQLSVALASVAEDAKAGLSAAAAAAIPFIDQVVAALAAGTPGAATAALGDAGFGDDPAS